MLKLILLPGLDGTGELFTEFVAALPTSFAAVAVRYPTKQRASYAELEGIVRAACSASEPFILVAESYSTPLAIKFAAAHPANLAAVVLCAGFASSPVQGWRRLLGSLLAPLVFHFPIPDFGLKFWLVGADASTSLLTAVRGATSSVKPKVLAARLREALKCDVRGELNKVDVPILYLRASEDRLVGESCLEDIQRIKPKVRVVAVKGPHLLLQRQPWMAAETIVEFARSSRPSPMP